MTNEEQALITSFEAVLNDYDKNENDVQNFLEKNTELIPLPFLLNHRLHLNSIITKFPISTSLTTDFLYITKSSDRWYVVCVELENQHKRIFTNSKPSIHFTSEFNNAYDQISSWKSYISEHKREVKDLLSVLLKPIQMSRNPIEFKYVLVLGRNSEKRTVEHIHMFNQKNTEDVLVMTYDSIISTFINRPKTEKHVILSKSGTGFKIKYLDSSNVQLFGHLNEAELEVISEHYDQLKQWGYDMDAWKNGEYLAINDKIPLSKEGEFIKSMISGLKSKDK